MVKEMTTSPYKQTNFFHLKLPASGPTHIETDSLICKHKTFQVILTWSSYLEDFVFWFPYWIKDFLSDSTDRLLTFLYDFPVMDKIVFTFLNQTASINVIWEDSTEFRKGECETNEMKRCHHRLFLTTLL